MEPGAFVRRAIEQDTDEGRIARSFHYAGKHPPPELLATIVMKQLDNEVQVVNVPASLITVQLVWYTRSTILNACESHYFSRSRFRINLLIIFLPFIVNRGIVLVEATIVVEVVAG